MNQVKAWVIILALVSFGAGLAAGIFWTTQRLRPQVAPGPFDQYRERLITEFDVPADRIGPLTKILAAYEKEIEQIKDRYQVATMAQMEPELADRGRYYRDLIQNSLLQGAQRERFRQLASDLPTQPQ